MKYIQALSAAAAAALTAFDGEEDSVQDEHRSVIEDLRRAVDLYNLMVVNLTKQGCARVLNGHEGMTFVVEDITGPVRAMTVHVRDYRYAGDHRAYQIWSLGQGDYEVTQ